MYAPVLHVHAKMTDSDTPASLMLFFYALRADVSHSTSLPVPEREQQSLRTAHEGLFPEGRVSSSRSGVPHALTRNVKALWRTPGGKDLPHFRPGLKAYASRLATETFVFQQSDIRQ